MEPRPAAARCATPESLRSGLAARCPAPPPACGAARSATARPPRAAAGAPHRLRLRSACSMAERNGLVRRSVNAQIKSCTRNSALHAAASQPAEDRGRRQQRAAHGARDGKAEPRRPAEGETRAVRQVLRRAQKPFLRAGPRGPAAPVGSRIPVFRPAPTPPPGGGRSPPPCSRGAADPPQTARGRRRCPSRSGTGRAIPGPRCRDRAHIHAPARPAPRPYRGRNATPP